MNSVKQGTWTRPVVDGFISGVLFNAVAGMHAAARNGDDQKTNAYIEAYKTVLEFAWQRGYRAKNLESIAVLPKRFMPDFYYSNEPLLIEPIGQSAMVKDAMIESIKIELGAIVKQYGWASAKNLASHVEQAETGYWHVMRIGWEFGWRPNDLDDSEKLPPSMMPDFYRNWKEKGCE